MNILVSPLPRSVRVGGASFPIASGYRIGLQVARIADSELEGRFIAAGILQLYFGSEPPEDRGTALDAVLEFHRCGQPPPKRTRRGPRLIDWDHDAGTILADFRREYDIDLADEKTRIHWWAFMAYFDNLSADSEIKRAMYYRSAKPRGLKGEDAKRFAAMKRTYALPPKTASEARVREAELWGD